MHVSPAILAVEDNPDNMELFAWILEDAGYAFEGVGTAEEGLASLERRSFDLVLMDIALSGHRRQGGDPPDPRRPRGSLASRSSRSLLTPARAKPKRFSPRASPPW